LIPYMREAFVAEIGFSVTLIGLSATEIGFSAT
jgi:hypothetical protein